MLETQARNAEARSRRCQALTHFEIADNRWRCCLRDWISLKFSKISFSLHCATKRVHVPKPVASSRCISRLTHLLTPKTRRSFNLCASRNLKERPDQVVKPTANRRRNNRNRHRRRHRRKITRMIQVWKARDLCRLSHRLRTLLAVCCCLIRERFHTSRLRPCSTHVRKPLAHNR